MKNISNTSNLVPLALVLANFAILTSSSAFGAVIVSDSLSGTGHLAGSTDDQGAVYSGSSSFTRTSAGATDAGGSGSSTVLNFGSVATNKVYTLSVTEAGGNGAPIFFGFDDLTTDTSLQFYSITGPNIQSYGGDSSLNAGENGGNSTITYAENGNGHSDNLTNGLLGPNTFTLVLDTTGAKPTVTAELNHIAYITLTYNSFADVSALNGIVFSDVGAGGTSGSVKFSALSLTTAAVPEPTTWSFVLLGLGVLGFQLRQRSRRND